MAYRKIIPSAIFGIGSLMLAHGGADAAIRCDGNFQIVRGQPVSTLYCREMNLSRVARTYGWHISADAIRYSENTKAQVCRAIGFDLRVNEICAPFQSGGGNQRLTN